MKKTIAIINLMPTKQETERQWQTLLGDSIETVWIRMKSHISKNTSPEYLASKYVTFEETLVDQLDGVILTGAPIETLPFEAVSYWEELTYWLNHLIRKGVCVLSVCWGAQALLYHRFGIEKHLCDRKIFGIFAHEVASQDLFPGLNDPVFFPHSRHTTWHRLDIEANPKLKITLDSNEVGPFALCDEIGNWYLTGHMEYAPDTLINEYDRDVGKGLSIEIPKGYGEKSGVNRPLPTKEWQSESKYVIDVWLKQLKKGDI